jgi:hypothetical protein
MLWGKPQTFVDLRLGEELGGKVTNPQHYASDSGQMWEENVQNYEFLGRSLFFVRLLHVDTKILIL